MLHEIGHLTNSPTGYSIYDEAVAWRWALQNSRLEATPAVRSDIDGCMCDYIYFRCGYATLQDALDELPIDAMREAVAGLYETITASPARGH